MVVICLFYGGHLLPIYLLWAIYSISRDPHSTPVPIFGGRALAGPFYFYRRRSAWSGIRWRSNFELFVPWENHVDFHACLLMSRLAYREAEKAWQDLTAHIFLQGPPSSQSWGFEVYVLESSQGWLAETVVSYCHSKTSELQPTVITKHSDWLDGGHCK